MLNGYCRLGEFVTHDHVSHNLKCKSYPFLHGFTESGTLSVATYVDSFFFLCFADRAYQYNLRK